MNYLNPVYTEKRECQDCYKCVRNCPVKAIKVEDGAATVMPELCIACGRCIEICPNDAKRVRDDLPRARQLLTIRPKCFVSLAPSYAADFPGIRPGQIIGALKRLGFAGVSETALGAQQVSAHVARSFEEEPGRVLLSSACPSVVAYLQKQKPQWSGGLTGLLSPLLTHCHMLRQSFGQDIGIVFIGPCVAKKLEADAHPELLDVALTFEDMRRWLEAEKIELESVQEQGDDRFVPEPAAEGVIYPIDGGMIAGIRAHCAVVDPGFMAFSGISAIEQALSGLDELKVEEGLFLELLACEGGCINGPKMHRKAQTAAKRYDLLRQFEYSKQQVPRRPEFSIDQPLRKDAQPAPVFTDFQLRDALRTVGKLSIDDELNCGGCGYDSCRQFAQALLTRKAERSMCVTYMRKLAHKKANALIQKMPSAVVIVDSSLKILECNAAFVRLLGREVNSEEDASQLDGAALASVIPFHQLFASVLRSGEELHDRDLRFRDAILHLSIFNIERSNIVGAIMQDITRPAVQKEQVIRRAQEVIQKNLSTVQKIAFLLGENAAESEVTLNSIIDSFSPPKVDEGGKDNDWRKLYRR